MSKAKLILAISLPLIAIIFCGLSGAVFYWLKWRTYEPLNEIRTLKISKDKQFIRFRDPFGVAASSDGIIYASDGDEGKIWAVDEENNAKVLAEGLDTPSCITLAPDGNLIVADSGDHTVKKIETKSGVVKTIAGVKGKAGFADGKSDEALFNAPVGIAVGEDGIIYVADTYNDRVRSIDTDGRVKTIAGGDVPDYVDNADGLSARFDTPCGIAVLNDGSLIVADTGNNALRRIEKNGAVTTITKGDEQNQFEFYEPTGIAVADEETFYVTHSGNAAIKICKSNPTIVCSQFAGNGERELNDGELSKAGFNRPSNIAVAYNGMLVIADTGNGLIRTVVGKERMRGEVLTNEEVKSLRPKAEEFRAAAPPRWCYEPPERPREIAATFGEIRGEMKDQNGEAHFHNGLDIPGAMGEEARAVRTEKSLLPLPVGLFGTRREYLRLPTMGYVHINVGRDLKDKVLNKEKFLLRYDKDKKLSGVRIRRGTKFNAGDTLGTLNNMYHVHLIAGPTGGEMNALAALELPGIKDTVAPTIEKDGVKFFDKDWNGITPQFHQSAIGNRQSAMVRVVVEAYDQMDGNAARRKLGAYKLGYQILKADGSAVDGFAEPMTTISFERLPDETASNLVYAKGSRADATGETTFAYIVTNSIKDGEAKESFWDTSKLNEGDYIVRVFVEDFFGNRTTKDVAVKIKN
jgi:sugar lactone lactonase YvrE